MDFKETKELSEFTFPPKRFYKDRDWAHKHLNDLAREYPDLWVAIYKKKVVASGKNLAEVKKMGEQKTKKEQCFYLLAQVHWY